jgi:hypothetical protein
VSPENPHSARKDMVCLFIIMQRRAQFPAPGRTNKVEQRRGKSKKKKTGIARRESSLRVLSFCNGGGEEVDGTTRVVFISLRPIFSATSISASSNREWRNKSTETENWRMQRPIAVRDKQPQILSRLFVSERHVHLGCYNNNWRASRSSVNNSAMWKGP